MTDSDRAALAPLIGGVVAIVRAGSPRRLLDLATALVAGGVRSLEVTLRTDSALNGISHLTTHLDDDVAIGAGTVVNLRQADEAVAAGAGYLVSPGLAPHVIERGRSHGVPVIPGVLTPTEVMAARSAGAKVVKLFPAGSLGPSYVRELLGPFGDLEILPTGGVSIESVPDYLEAGAIAVGLGTALLADAESGGSLSALERRTRWLTDLVATSRPLAGA